MVMSLEEYLEAIKPLYARKDESIVSNVIICAAICGAATILIFILRLATSLTLTIKWGRHGWFFTVAAIFLLLQVTTLGAASQYGLGRHVVAVTDPGHIVTLQTLGVVNEVAYFVSIGFIKLSITSLYSSIFPQKKFHYLCWAIDAFNVCWMISTVFVCIFQCNPPRRTFNPYETGGTCVNWTVALVSTTVLSIFTDICVLILPIPLVLKLKMSGTKKILILLTFAVGGLACAASFVRFTFVVRLRSSLDGTWDGAYLLMMGTLELITGFLCACLPTLRPLYRRIFRGPLGTTKPSNVQYDSSMEGNAARSSVMRSKPGDSVMTDVELITVQKKSSSWVRDSNEEDEIGLTAPESLKPPSTHSRSSEAPHV